MHNTTRARIDRENSTHPWHFWSRPNFVSRKRNDEGRPLPAIILSGCFYFFRSARFLDAKNCDVPIVKSRRRVHVITRRPTTPSCLFALTRLTKSFLNERTHTTPHVPFGVFLAASVGVGATVNERKKITVGRFDKGTRARSFGNLS